MGVISWTDLVIWLVYLVLITLVLWVYRVSKSESHYKYFMPAFFLKVLGGVAFCLVYTYYYGFGDTFLYSKGARILSETLLESPVDYFRLLISGNGNLPPDLHSFSSSVIYSRTFEEWFMVKLLSPLSLLSFNSYLVMTLLISTLSFAGAWKLMLVFRDILPHKQNYAFFAAFLVPSVIFWGSGIMKDTVTLLALNYIIYSLYYTFKKGDFNWRRIILALVCMLLIFKLKSYILIAFLPTMIFFFYYLFQSKINSNLTRSIVRPLMLIGVIGIVFVALINISGVSQKYNIDRLEGSVKGFHSWHTTQGGSVYSLGEVELTPIGIVSKIPEALNVTFFRPYFWEYFNPVIMMGALESFLVLILFLNVLWYSKLRPVSYLRNSYLLKGLIFFILIFGFAVGFTAYNFGALARYKIPVMPSFVFILLFIYHKAKHKEVIE